MYPWHVLARPAQLTTEPSYCWSMVSSCSRLQSSSVLLSTTQVIESHVQNNLSFCNFLCWSSNFGKVSHHCLRFIEGEMMMNAPWDDTSSTNKLTTCTTFALWFISLIELSASSSLKSSNRRQSRKDNWWVQLMTALLFLHEWLCCVKSSQIILW